MIILNRIKELRQEKNINQDVLAKLLGLEIAGISKLETGRVPLKDDYIIKLADYFDVSTDYLLGKTDIRNPAEISDPLGLAEIGFSMQDYNPPNEKQREQLEEIIKTILKDNKKKKEGK